MWLSYYNLVNGYISLFSGLLVYSIVVMIGIPMNIYVGGFKDFFCNN